MNVTPAPESPTPDESQASGASLSEVFGRYDRQMRFASIGQAGQQRLAKSRVLVCGCGALGSASVELLARAGVGRLRIVDRDFLELNNLQRQTLYTEKDVATGLPKAEAARLRLSEINSDIQIESHVAELNHSNVLSLVDGCDLIVDGTDNFETRFLLNDVSVKTNTPWLFAGVLGADGQAMTILPGETACLSCLMPDGPPDVGTTPTCDSAGILSPIIQVMASIQATEALKILTGNREQISRALTVIGLWENQWRQLDLGSLREQTDCPTCKRHEFPWLLGERGSQSELLCGRNAVQIRFEVGADWSMELLASQLDADKILIQNRFMLRAKLDELTVTLFPDGRAIVGGTEDLERAKTVVSRYLGL